MKTVPLLIALALPSVAAASSRDQANWSALAPPGEGFAIEVPGEPHPTKEAGHYVYGDDDHAYIIKVDPVSANIREFVEARAREPLDWYLQRIASGLTNGGKSTVLYSSAEDYEGYPSLLIAHEGEEQNIAVAGIDRLVLTEEHLYMLITVFRQGTSKTDAERFLGSFHLSKPRSSPAETRTESAAPPTNPLVAKMAAPMLAVARLISEQELNPRIDELVQRAPASERFGTQWNPSNAAWQRARAVVADRVDRLFDAYESSGELEHALEAEVARLAPGAKRDELAAALDSPAGPAILRSCAQIHFVSTVMANDPDGPKPGERAWSDKMRALRKVFDDRIGRAVPLDDGTHGFEVSKYLATPAHQSFMQLWVSVVGKANSQFNGAVNLMMFDDHASIMRDIETAIASEK